jgi:hypothetical protein
MRNLSGRTYTRVDFSARDVHEWDSGAELQLSARSVFIAKTLERHVLAEMRWEQRNLGISDE